MQFAELRNALKDIAFCILRQDQNNYFEAVVEKGELIKVTESLERFLGSPLPLGQLPEHLKKTLKQIGGINHGQTLYCNIGCGDAVIAVLWPWTDGLSTTLKIIKYE